MDRPVIRDPSMTNFGMIGIDYLDFVAFVLADGETAEHVRARADRDDEPDVLR
jgi:hypothetical protein